MADGPPAWFLVGSLAVAVIGPTVAFIVASRQVSSALKVAKRQADSAERIADKNFKGNIVAANRQRWLDELRSDVASFVADTQRIRSQASVSTDDVRALNFALSKVRMRINSSKPDQKVIVDHMREIMSNVRASDLNAKLEALMASVEVLAASVWRKVKAGS